VQPARAEIIQLPGGHAIAADNVHAWSDVVRAHGALTVLAEDPAPISHHKVDEILDMLTGALEHIGALRRDVTGAVVALGVLPPLLI
jgi:hypothetical protein